MADSILRLKVESSEYDNKLKRAAEGIRHLADVAHKGGGELTGLEKAELDYIKSLGDMETKSRSAAGQVRELESTYKELKVIYDQLNEVEKADEGGKALVASLEQIKTRAQEARTQLENASKSLSDNGQEAQQSSSALDALASKFTVNIDALKLFDIGLQAAKAAIDVAKDAFFASEATVDEWGRTMQSAQGLYEGFLNAINNGDISGYLSRMDDIVKAAREAYNALDTLQTMKTIQGPGMSKQQTENERIRQMIQTGRYIAPVDGRKNAVWNGQEMKNGQPLAPEQIRILERQLQGGLQKMTGFVKNEVDQTGKAIDAYCIAGISSHGSQLELPVDALIRAQKLLWAMPEVQAEIKPMSKLMRDKPAQYPKDYVKSQQNFQDAVGLAYMLIHVYGVKADAEKYPSIVEAAGLFVNTQKGKAKAKDAK